jgi:hypothetical protein
MVTSIFHGELGNNLFQLAAILSLKEELKVNYELLNTRDSWVSSFRPLEIKNLFEYEFNFVEDLSQNYNLYHHTDLHAGIPNYSFEYNPIPKIDNINIRGYFQTEKYFLNIKEKLINEYFEPKREVVEYILNKYGNLLNNSVSIHVRAGGDRPSCHDTFPLITSEYYEKALDIIKRKNKIDNILVFSDNMEVAKKILSPEYTFIENESNINDLIFMSLCNHNIIGNSTFSWWSAYLNKNKNKTIIAPYTDWFGGHLKSLSIKDLFPDTWITL